MLNRRAVIMATAVALGGVAAITAVIVVKSAQNRAASKSAGVGVFVVAKQVPAGTTGDVAIASGLVRQGSIPRSLFPSTAVTDINAIKGKVTPSDLAAGQIIVDNQFIQRQATTTSTSGVNIPAGEVAITISLDPVRAVAGLIVPGDKIDLMSVFTPNKATTAAAAAADSGTYAHIFYQNAEVLAIGTTLAPAAGSTQAAANSGSSLYTLAVSPEAAERIVLAATGGNLYAALVPPNNKAGQIPAVAATAVDGPQPLTYAPVPALTPSGK